MTKGSMAPCSKPWIKAVTAHPLADVDGYLKQGAAMPNLRETLRTLSAAWDAALIANDAPAVAAFMAEDWVYVTETGPVPKADIIGWIAAGRLQHFSSETVGPDRIVIHGDTAVMTSRKRS